MIQNILVALFLCGAVFYIGRMVYQSFQSKNACSTGCGKCEAAEKAMDFTAKN